MNTGSNGKYKTPTDIINGNDNVLAQSSNKYINDNIDTRSTTWNCRSHLGPHRTWPKREHITTEQGPPQ